MSKIGLLIHSIVPEQAAVIYNSCMIHNMKQLDVSFMIKPKKNPKTQFGTFWTQIEQTSH